MTKDEFYTIAMRQNMRRRPKETFTEFRTRVMVEHRRRARRLAEKK